MPGLYHPPGEGLAIPIQQRGECVVEQKGYIQKIEDTAVGTGRAAGKGW